MSFHKVWTTGLISPIIATKLLRQQQFTDIDSLVHVPSDYTLISYHETAGKALAQIAILSGTSDFLTTITVITIIRIEFRQM